MELTTASASSKKWLWAGLIIAFLNPIFAGLVLGSLYLTEPQLKRQGKIILVFAVLWGTVAFLVIRNLQARGLIPQF